MKMNDDDFLAAVKTYIEEVEVKIDGEWGMERTLAELIAEGEMPPIYVEALRRTRPAVRVSPAGPGTVAACQTTGSSPSFAP